MILDILGIGTKLLDKVIPDPVERDKAKMELLKLQQQGTFREIEIAMEAITTEAKSADPWTSRARPSFLYVMYVIILSAIPFGILTIFFPDQMMTPAEGFKRWLAAIPESMWALFGAGYLGYVGARTVDKFKK